VDRTDADGISVGSPTTAPRGVPEPLVVGGDRPKRPGVAGRARWAAAVGGSAAVIVASAILGAVLVGGAGPSGLLARTPADSVAYVELRLDLPGNQRDALGRFLAHVPGFDDRSLLEPKLADLFERTVVGASGGRLHWSGGIDAWFGGQAALALRNLPDPGSEPFESAPLLLAAVRDPVAARSWSTAALDALGLSWTLDRLAGREVLLVGGAPSPRAVAVEDDVLVAGRLDDVRAVLETGPASSLGAAASTRAALDALPADHVAWLYVDGVAVRAWLAGALSGAGTAGELPGLEVPTWFSAELRFDADLAVVEAAAPVRTAGRAAEAPPTLAGRVPADALAFAAVGGFGASLTERVDALRRDPAVGASVEGLLAILDRVGGLEAVAGWIDELGLVAGVEADRPWAALVAVPRDRAAAEALAGSLLNLARLSVPGLVIDEVSVNGTTIVSVELPASGGGAPPTDDSGRLRVAWAVGPDVVVLAPEAAVVRRILELDPSASLARNERYATLIARAGGPGGSRVVFLDLARLRALAETGLEPADRARYERDLRPYLVPFDAAAVVSRTDGDLERSILVVRVVEAE
jgi:hypothetical protein